VLHSRRGISHRNFTKSNAYRLAIAITITGALAVSDTVADTTADPDACQCIPLPRRHGWAAKQPDHRQWLVLPS